MSIRLLPDGTFEFDSAAEALEYARLQHTPDAPPEAPDEEPGEPVPPSTNSLRHLEAQLTDLLLATLELVRRYPDGVSVAGATREISLLEGKEHKTSVIGSRLQRLTQMGLLTRPRWGFYVPVTADDTEENR